MNGYDNITAYNVALSDEHNYLKMENLQYNSTETINIGNAHLDAYYDSGYNEVEVRPLDSYEFDSVSVIKIDVQGYEPRVLNGAIETIKRHKPVIFIEVESPQLQIYGYTQDDVFERLNSMGYKYKKVLNAEHLVDYVAVPE
ncbi:MAG: FkbM family methyltransferase [Actinobacteria bacterium]|nr:FkbM family methyltransferase [Actinomycetota bacterium]